MKLRQVTAAGAVLWAATTLAGTYGWNIGNGIWDTTSANWSGEGTAWVDASGNTAIFTNNLPAAATRIALDGARTAGAVKIGNASNNARYHFTNGTLNASSLTVLGLAANGSNAGSTTPTVLSNLTLTTAGHIGVGKWTLVIGGSSVVNVGGMIGGQITGIGNADWGYVTIQDNAMVTANGGVSGETTEAWILNLNGGTLVTKSIWASDREAGGIARLTFNGTVVKPTQDTNSFATVGRNNANTYSALVGNGGAVFDTDGKNIGIKINLKPSGSTGGLTKLGAGTLTISGTNTYSGATLVSNGTLVASALALPVGTHITAAETALLDLAGASHTVAGLSGKGTVSNGTLTVTGLIQPGGTNVIGTLTVPGGMVLGGKLLADAAEDGTCDVLAVQGGCDVSAATLAVAASATLNTSTNYTLLTCTGTPTRFASVSVPSGWTLRYVDGAIRLVPSSTVSFNWNVGNGDWDTTSENWSGVGTTWVDSGHYDAFFTNVASATTVTLTGSRLADTVRVGNGGNNAKFDLQNGTLSLYSLIVQGSGSNGKNAGSPIPASLSGVTVTNAGDMTVSYWTLALGGASSVDVGGVIGGENWGTLTIKDSAVVRAAKGVISTAEAWALNLSGGTLVAKSIRASDREVSGQEARLTFNGTVVKPTQSTNDFVTVGFNVGATASALVGNGGAVFDTDGKDVGITIGLKQAGGGGLTKLGAGTLTLYATNNTYAGATTISGGSLAVSADNPSTGGVAIANASFETYDGVPLVPSGGPTAYRFAPTGASWAFTSQAGITTSNSYFMAMDAGQDGLCAGFLYGADTISQTLTVATAGLYDLRFMAAKGRNYFFNWLVVKIDGTAVCDYARGTLTDNYFKNFETKNIALSAGSHTLAFQGLNPQVYIDGKLPATVLDRVTLTPSAGGLLPDGTAVNITAAGASYVQGRSSQTIGSLAGVAGSSVVNSGVLTVGGNNADATFAGVISGSGSLVKAGNGTLTLGGLNTYTGATAVVAGTFEITAANTLSTNTALEVATGAFVKLSNAEEQRVASLTFDGMPRYRGTWGSPESTASLKSPRFTGAGILRVLTGETSPGTLIRIH